MVTQRHEVTARYANPSDFEEINSVFNRAFQQHRSLDEFRWKFTSSQTTHHVPVAVVGTINHRIVGVFGLQPHQLRVSETIVNAVQVLDVCVLPEFRHSGVNRATLEYFLNTAFAFSEFAFGFPGDFYAAVGLEKLGYKLLTTLVAYRWAPAADSPSALPHESAESAIEMTSSVPEDWARFFVEHLQQFEIATERTTAFLRWRYQSFPHRQFAFLSVRRGNELLGLAVIGLRGSSVEGQAWIYELLAKDRSTVVIILRHILRTFATTTPRELWYWCSPTASWQREIEEIGFRRHEHGLSRAVGVTLGEPDKKLQTCFQPEAWYLTIGDTDL